MTTAMTTVIFPVGDLTKAKKLFGALLGVEPVADSHYVGYQLGATHIGLDPNGAAQGQTGPLAFFDVPDIAAAIASLAGEGATVAKDPADVGGGMLVATLHDSDGNPIGLRQLPTQG